MLTCVDYVDFQAPRLKKDALDFFHDAMKDGGKVLLVGSNATYSGYLLNGRTYPGTHMKQGVETWCDKDHGGVAPCNAPVLLFHDAKVPAIGRVVKAAYQRLWSGDDWFNDWRKPARGYEKGSGYTRLQMAITDADAQEKFLDGRYKTFSTSFRSPHILCSICGTNLVDGDCDHQIGKAYETRDGEERECYLVTGMQFNKECSVVNHPAQPWAVGDEVRFVEDVKAALSDSQVDQEMLDSKYTLGLGLTKISDGVMLAVADMAGNATLLTVKDGESDTIPARGKGNVELPKKFVVPDLDGSKGQVKDEDRRELDDDEWALAHIVSGLVKRGLLETGDLKDVCVVKGASIAYISGLTGDAGGHQHSVFLTIDLAARVVRGWTDNTFPTKKNVECEFHSHPIEFPVDDLNADVFSGETRDASCGENHLHTVEVSIARDAHTVPSIEECLDLAAQFDSLRDADISPSRRKLLKSNAFCGPGRTIPVPDLTHADAARRIAPRLKGTAAQKAAVLKAVSDRASAFRFVSRDAGNHTETKDTMAQMTTPPSPSGSGKPGTEPAGTPDTKLDDKDKTLKLLTDQVTEEKDRVKSLQSELDSTKAEREAVQKKLTDSETALHKERCQRLAMLRALTGEKPSGFDLDTADGLNSYATELMKRTPDSISDSIADALGPVVAKLPKLKGLGGFIQDGTQPARDGSGQDLKRKLEDDASKKSATEKKTVSGKDLV
jgi:hypothetical protein